MDEKQPDEIERLLIELRDDRRDVRSRAAYELGKHNTDPRIVMPLIASLSDSDKFVRSWAAGALAKVGPNAIAPMLKVLECSDRTVAFYAAVALGELNVHGAIPALAQAMREGDWDIRPTAAEALAQMGDAESLPDRILADTGLSASERIEILQSLSGLTYRDETRQLHFEIGDLSQFLSGRADHPEEQVRRAAVETLQTLEDSLPPAVEAIPAPRIDSQPQESLESPSRDASGGQPSATEALESGSARRSLWDRLTRRNDSRAR